MCDFLHLRIHKLCSLQRAVCSVLLCNCATVQLCSCATVELCNCAVCNCATVQLCNCAAPLIFNLCAQSFNLPRHHHLRHNSHESYSLVKLTGCMQGLTPILQCRIQVNSKFSQGTSFSKFLHLLSHFRSFVFFHQQNLDQNYTCFQFQNSI